MEVSARDVIRLMLQFCEENHLHKTMAALVEESQVALNTVPSVAAFTAAVTDGDWDEVLTTCSTLVLPEEKLFDLYETVVTEATELGEGGTARALLADTEAGQLMRTQDLPRYAELERLVSASASSALAADHAGSATARSTQVRRAALARALAAEVVEAPPSRLLALIGQALKWQQEHGVLGATGRFDLFTDNSDAFHDVEEEPPRVKANALKRDPESFVQVVAFSPDGLWLATGCNDGFIEVWSPDTLEHAPDLTYQSENVFMVHDDAVLSLAFAQDGELLASGARDGKIAVWSVRSGEALVNFDGAHPSGVLALDFSKDGSQLLSGSYDTTARLHGLRSERMLREFRGHASYVTQVLFSDDGAMVVTGSSDSTVKVWNAKTAGMIRSFRPPHASETAEFAIHSLAWDPADPARLIVSNRSSSVFVMDLTGKVEVTLTLPDEKDAVSITPSPRGEWLYVVNEAGILVAFNVERGRAEHLLKISKREPLGIAHHPRRNLVVTWTDNGVLKSWMP